MLSGTAIRRRLRGATLIELLIASSLSLLIMGLLWYQMQAGQKFYLRVRAQGDIQRGALQAVRWIARDVIHGNAGNLNSFTTPVIGMSFASPEDSAGATTYADTGAIEWRSTVIYYIDDATKNFYRVQRDYPGGKQDYPEPIGVSLTPAAVAGNLSMKPRLVAEHIIDLTVERFPKNIMLNMKARQEALGFGISVRTRLEMKN